VSAIVRGELPIRDANRLLELDVPQGEGWSTVAGLTISLAGGIPSRGARLRSGEISIEVLEATSQTGGQCASAARPFRRRAARLAPALPRTDPLSGRCGGRPLQSRSSVHSLGPCAH